MVTETPSNLANTKYSIVRYFGFNGPLNSISVYIRASPREWEKDKG